ncbi:hypothetical protein DI005_25380 [Prauserella sp. PE36]|uniref:DNA primase/polymerase bifunctional N-terminal domain-containing protein n=1 Tax=Prauserella endophytica TaxID=1592324 RepID=A0ABY2S624_9PSEU|nr:MULTISPECIES: hypothetical protein [Prauserella]RBM16186.1 hypothetical protein DI005_25380 [Prauserella sp. PE36]TKG70841.1 hypothetical protein FCN18_15055 [Prauserella endophytica]
MTASLLAAPGPAEDSAPLAENGGGWTIAEYRSVLGWTVTWGGGRPLLDLGHGMVAVTAPRPLAVGLAERLHRLDATGPVFAVDGARPYWVFLADPNDEVNADLHLPRGVEILGCPQRIPVPVEVPRSPALRWIVPPDTRRRWLPTLAAVALAAARTGRQ